MVEIYQEIAVKINGIIPEGWDKVFAYAEVQEDVSNVGFYYYLEGKDTPIHVLEIVELFEIDENEMDQLRYKLSDLFEELWRDFLKSNQEAWTNLTFILESTGQFIIDFDYEDLTEVDGFERQII